MDGERYVEVLPKFVHRVAPTTKGLARIKRRLGQLINAATHPDFQSSEELLNTTVKRYSSREEIDFYRHYVSFGLHEHELIPLNKALAMLGNERKNALVIGCGTGRECFALEALGFQVTGIDSCARMIEVASELKEEAGSKAQFIHGKVDQHQFDQVFQLVIPTYGLNNHIQGRERRVNILKIIKSLVSSQGKLIFFRDEQPFSWRSRFFVISQVLRWRWAKQGIWEKGDTLRSFLGPHNNTEQMVFWHYYPSPSALNLELKDAGYLDKANRDKIIFAKTADEQ